MVAVFRKSAWQCALAPIVALVLCLGVSSARAADDFPTKPVEVVIHSKYGGGTDTTARMMIARTRENLDTDMVVVAKRGGGAAKET